MLIRDNNNPGYLKLTYDTSRIGRVDRQLTFNHCLSSYETCHAIKNAIDSNLTPSGFGIQLEPAARISYLNYGNDIYEWGVIYREFSPYPYNNDDVLLVPGFSLFGKDINNPNDDSLIVQLIELSGVDPSEYLLTILKMIVDCYWEIVLSCAFHIECHGQNCFFELTPNYKIKRFIIKDMDSVDKDIPLAKKLGLNSKWESYPFMCFDESIYYYKIRSSYMYDFKLGEYLLSPLISEVAKNFLLDTNKIESFIRNYVREKYLVKLPYDYFPLDTLLSIFFRHQKRKYRNGLFVESTSKILDIISRNRHPAVPSILPTVYTLLLPHSKKKYLILESIGMETIIAVMTKNIFFRQALQVTGSAKAPPRAIIPAPLIFTKKLPSCVISEKQKIPKPTTIMILL